MLLSTLMPTNLEEEEQKFFESRTYGSFFKCPWFDSKYKRHSTTYSGFIKAIYMQNHESIVSEAIQCFQTEITQTNIHKCETILSSTLR